MLECNYSGDDFGFFMDSTNHNCIVAEIDCQGSQS